MKTPAKKIPKHGGKRTGSGRKPREIALVALTTRIRPDVSERLETLKARLGLSYPATLEWLLDTSEALRVHELAKDGEP